VVSVPALERDVASLADVLRIGDRLEGIPLHVCSAVNLFRHESTLTAGIRVAILDYFREGQLPDGRQAGWVAAFSAVNP